MSHPRKRALVEVRARIPAPQSSQTKTNILEQRKRGLKRRHLTQSISTQSQQWKVRAANRLKLLPRPKQTTAKAKLLQHEKYLQQSRPRLTWPKSSSTTTMPMTRQQQQQRLQQVTTRSQAMSSLSHRLASASAPDQTILRSSRNQALPPLPPRSKARRHHA